MESAEDKSGKIKKTEQNFQPRYNRMDAAFNLWNKKKIIYEKYGTNITSKKPRTFADDVQRDLSASDRQIQIRMAEAEGKDMRDEIGKLERLFEFLLELADERLIRLLLPPMKEYLIWSSIVRGWKAARILVYELKGKLIPDFLPLDPRGLSYEVGANGLSWSAYKMFKTAKALEEEFNYTPKGRPFYAFWQKEKELYEIYDYWEFEKPGRVWNAVICEDTYLKEPQALNLQSMPVLIMPVVTRPPVILPSGTIDDGYGEDIFTPNKDFYDLEGKLTSMWASHADILYQQPLFNYIDDQGKELSSTVLYAEGVINLPMGHQDIQGSPLKEISPTLLNLVAWVEDQIEDSSLPHLRLGTPPPSGTALDIYQQAGNRVYNPQTRSLNRFYEDVCRLIEEQLLTDKITVEIKSEKDKKYYGAKVTPVDLKKPHIIKVEHTVATPWSQMNVYQVAQMAKGLGIPDGWIWENILKFPDPKGLADLSRVEMAEHSPGLAMKKAIETLIKQERYEDALQLMRDYVRMDKQEEEQAGIGVERPPTETPPEEMPSA